MLLLLSNSGSPQQLQVDPYSAEDTQMANIGENERLVSF